MKAKVVCMTQLVEKSPQAIPLGAACIASAIKNSPLTKDYCDSVLLSFYPSDSVDLITQKILEQLKESEIKLCAFSIFVWNRIKLEAVAKNLQKQKVLCICGGPEVTAHPECFSYFDAVIPGEGENKVPAAIAKLLKLEVKTEIEAISLDKLSSPYLDGTINPAEYGGALWELARGCPFKCSYCYESKGEKTVRLFPMERIKKELELFAEKKVPQVFVLDPTYNANKKRAVQLLNMIAEKTPNTFYYFEARAEFIDRELARAFTKIPCAVQFGLQSADENVLKLVNRSFNKKQFVKNIGIMNEEGVVFGFDLIYGLPGESLKGFKDGIDFAISLYPNNLELFCLSVLPGTDLFDRADSLNLHYEKEPPYHIIYTDKYSKTDIQVAEKLSKACTVFYNDGRAVPWFNTICRTLRIKPSQFFVQLSEHKMFADFLKNNDCNNCDHKIIEKLQLDFVFELFKQKKMDRFIKLAADVIKLNGAISRVQDTGKKESVSLTYPADYIDSQYATDFQFFLSNIKPSPKKIEITKKNSQIHLS